MEAAFKQLLEQDFNVLGIFLSSRISGTMESALKALEGLPQAAGKIAVVDSLWTTMAMGWPVLTAARAAQAGESLENCRKVAENACENTGVFFVVETLEFMRRGGRIGGAQALLGTALNIKPVLVMQKGRIEPVEKIRTKKKALQRILELTAERIGSRSPVRVATVHANAEAEALSLLDEARKAYNPIETLCCPLSPAIGTHVGPGTIAMPYMAGVE
jgi:DegV family protein with EDD domain